VALPSCPFPIQHPMCVISPLLPACKTASAYKDVTKQPLDFSHTPFSFRYFVLLLLLLFRPSYLSSARKPHFFFIGAINVTTTILPSQVTQSFLFIVLYLIPCHRHTHIHTHEHRVSFPLDITKHIERLYITNHIEQESRFQDTLQRERETQHFQPCNSLPHVDLRFADFSPVVPHFKRFFFFFEPSLTALFIHEQHLQCFRAYLSLRHSTSRNGFRRGTAV
jgi:hypothetical protein